MGDSALKSDEAFARKVDRAARFEYSRSIMELHANDNLADLREMLSRQTLKARIKGLVGR